MKKVVLSVLLALLVLAAPAAAQTITQGSVTTTITTDYATLSNTIQFGLDISGGSADLYVYADDTSNYAYSDLYMEGASGTATAVSGFNVYEGHVVGTTQTQLSGYEMDGNIGSDVSEYAYTNDYFDYGVYADSYADAFAYDWMGATQSQSLGVVAADGTPLIVTSSTSSGFGLGDSVSLITDGVIWAGLYVDLATEELWAGVERDQYLYVDAVGSITGIDFSTMTNVNLADLGMSYSASATVGASDYFTYAGTESYTWVETGTWGSYAYVYSEVEAESYTQQG